MKYILVPAGTPINSVIVVLESRNARTSKTVSKENNYTNIPMYFEVNDNIIIEYERKKPRLYTFWIKEEKLWYCFNIQAKYIKEIE